MCGSANSACNVNQMMNIEQLACDVNQQRGGLHHQLHSRIGPPVESTHYYKLTEWCVLTMFLG
jgi:hypothetical protein